jgi:ethanolamine utilization protein EutN
VILARVVGNVVATQKFFKYEGLTFLQVQRLDLGRKPVGLPFTAIDLVEAGEGDEVLVCLEAQSAVDAIGRGENPVDAVVVAVIDQVKLADTEKGDPWTRV